MFKGDLFVGSFISVAHFKRLYEAVRGEKNMDFGLPTGKDILKVVAVIVVASALAGAGILKLIQIM